MVASRIGVEIANDEDRQPWLFSHFLEDCTQNCVAAIAQLELVLGSGPKIEVEHQTDQIGREAKEGEIDPPKEENLTKFASAKLGSHSWSVARGGSADSRRLTGCLRVGG